VSRVINNNGRFSSATKEKVLAVIQEHGYTPNSMARALRTSRTRTIGVIVPDVTNEFFAKLTLFIQQTLFEQDYSTLIYNTDENTALEDRHLQALTAQSVSGVIFISGNGRNKVVHAPDVPTIFLDRKPHLKSNCMSYIHIRTDHREGGYLAGKALLDSGCVKPGIVMGPQRLFSQAERFKGFVQALKEGKRSLSESSIIRVEKINYYSAYSGMLAQLKKGIVKDGYFCTTDWLAVGAMRGLTERNIKVPEQVKLVGFDNISISEYSKLTTIHQDIKGMGKTAAHLMLQMLNGDEIKEREYIFQPSLVKRMTTQFGKSGNVISR
jgi:LacI family transcriptional regulator